MIENILGSSDASVDVCCVLLKEPSHPKISNLRNPFLIEQNVASLDVSVDNAVRRVFVEIEKSSSNACYDLKPLLPVYPRSSVRFCKPPRVKKRFSQLKIRTHKWFEVRELTEEDFVEALVCHVLVNQELILTVSAIAPEVNDITMLDFS